MEGNFDDAQTGVKRLFSSAEFRRAGDTRQAGCFPRPTRINFGRLVPQVVYYFSAYADLLKRERDRAWVSAVNFVVPTGNFGNILAAYYARNMGLPIHEADLRLQPQQRADGFLPRAARTTRAGTF